MVVFELAKHPATEILFPEATPDYERLQPHECVTLLGQVPDIRLIKRVVILDLRHRGALEAIKRTNQPDFQIFAEANNNGEITLFRPTRGQRNLSILVHEWSHLLRFASPREAILFDSIEGLEDYTLGNQPSPRYYDKDGLRQEWWASIGELLVTDVDPLVSSVTAMCNPIRVCVWWRCLQRRLSDLPEELLCSNPYLLKWDLFITQAVLPFALDTLKGHVARTDPLMNVQIDNLIAELTQPAFGAGAATSALLGDGYPRK